MFKNLFRYSVISSHLVIAAALAMDPAFAGKGDDRKGGSSGQSRAKSKSVSQSDADALAAAAARRRQQAAARANQNASPRTPVSSGKRKVGKLNSPIASVLEARFSGSSAGSASKVAQASQNPVRRVKRLGKERGANLAALFGGASSPSSASSSPVSSPKPTGAPVLVTNAPFSPPPPPPSSFVGASVPPPPPPPPAGFSSLRVPLATPAVVAEVPAVVQTAVPQPEPVAEPVRHFSALPSDFRLNAYLAVNPQIAHHAQGLVEIALRKGQPTTVRAVIEALYPIVGGDYSLESVLGVFNVRDYVRAYADLRKGYAPGGVLNEAHARQHFIEYGYTENRLLAPVLGADGLPNGFNVQVYAALNPDLCKNPGEISPSEEQYLKEHYKNNGHREKRFFQ